MELEQRPLTEDARSERERRRRAAEPRVEAATPPDASEAPIALGALALGGMLLGAALMGKMLGGGN
ncbi:MAG: hypothetical protein AAFW46_14365 [Pseudomonadota bacterium]